MSIICPLCGIENDNEATHCKRCGVPISTDPLKTYVPSFVLEKMFRETFKIERDMERYDAGFSMSERGRINWMYYGNIPGKEALWKTILFFPVRAVKFTIRATILSVIYILGLFAFGALLDIAEIILSTLLLGDKAGYYLPLIYDYDSEMVILLTFVVPIVYAILRCAEKVPRVRDVICLPSRRKRVKWEARADEVLSIKFRRLMEGQRNECIRIRKDSLARIPGMKPEYWNDVDIKALQQILSSTNPNPYPETWEDVYKLLETPEQKKKSKAYRKNALSLLYTHEKLGDPVDQEVYNPEAYMDKYAPDWREFYQYNKHRYVC